MCVGGKDKELEWLYGINKEDGGELIKELEEFGCRKICMWSEMDLILLLIEEGVFFCVV